MMIEKGWSTKVLPDNLDSWVELQDYMGTDQDIVNAARTSVLGESKGEEADKKLLFYLMEHHHDSPFEMAEVKLRISAPVVVWWQIVRHRTLNLNLQSGRYMEFEEDKVYIPGAKNWRLQSKKNKQGSDGFLPVEEGGELLTMLMEKLWDAQWDAYQQALKMGVAKEMARYFLPGWNLIYQGVVKCDLRNWLHFVELRNAREAQFEIRAYANEIHYILSDLYPWTCQAYKEFRHGN